MLSLGNLEQSEYLMKADKVDDIFNSYLDSSSSNIHGRIYCTRTIALKAFLIVLGSGSTQFIILTQGDK